MSSNRKLIDITDIVGADRIIISGGKLPEIAHHDFLSHDSAVWQFDFALDSLEGFSKLRRNKQVRLLIILVAQNNNVRRTED